MGIFQCDCIHLLSGLNLKTLVIDLSKDEVRVPVFIRAEQGWKVADLKAEIAEVCICLSIFPIGHSIRLFPMYSCLATLTCIHNASLTKPRMSVFS